jgi:hypothetical protein
MSLLHTVKHLTIKEKHADMNIFNNSKEELLLPSIREMKKAKFKSTCDLKSSALGM